TPSPLSLHDALPISRAKIRTMETIGRYPLISLKSAREEARRRLADAVLTGSIKSRVRASEALDEYLAEVERKRRPRTHADYKRLDRKSTRLNSSHVS